MKRILIIIAFLLTGFNLYGEKFYLRNGEVIEGKVIEDRGDVILLKVGYGTMEIEKTQILRYFSRHISSSNPHKETSPEKRVPQERSNDDFQDKAKAVYDWLRLRVDEKTGLVESFHPTGDVYLKHQASTYDQALVGLAFLVEGDYKRAKGILEFYNKKWDGNGFCNFYFSTTGNPGIEHTIHTGPNIWIAILALHYTRMVKDPEYIPLAISITKWAMRLPHYNGGIAMGYIDEWRAAWSKVVSTENNIDYLVLLNLLLYCKDAGLIKRGKEEFWRKIKVERSNVEEFLRGVVYDPQTGALYRGFSMGKVDREYAMDSYSWLINTVGLEELDRWGITPGRFIKVLEKHFYVKDRGIKGFDFTDKRGAFKARRARMVSTGWTLSMVNGYKRYSRYFGSLYKRTGIGGYKVRSRIYRQKAIFLLREMDKLAIPAGLDGEFLRYPYASRADWLVFYDSPWWRTPKGVHNGLQAGSVASGAWRIFAGRFNPFDPEGRI